ncbi:SIMPL domain-containing protein [Psychroserpens algicola]|uniref:SIMPL domain-containing protein n=1 Tax=Psychroserpens algicola TaxID=1719034 RepID=A0ABT0HCR7_9FLAO|nr:SIMPL domain-containing protein [Psychroserpens algicola]MCK8482165.1 SIMPL domain-containing protein [Psychroserpens algicola]
MKTKTLSLLLICVCFFTSFAQHKGNYDQISRQNILLSGNATIYNPTVQQNINKGLTPSTHVFIDVKALQNVQATTYTAIFNVSQIGPTADSTALLINQRIQNIKSQLKPLGITDDDIAVDVISFVPNYEIEVQKKLFSKTYTEVPNGFELQQNLHIQFTKTSQFESILTACAKSEIYNLVKVDYYIEHIAEVYKNLQTKLLKLIEEKKAYYKVLGFDLANYNVAIADDQYCYFPKDFYQSYQAFNSVSFEAIKKNRGITTAKKQTSYYYQPLSYENYDVVVNPSILEPVVQIGMNIRLQYSPKPKEVKPEPVVKTEIKHKYYVVSPNGTIDIKALQTN